MIASAALILAGCTGVVAARDPRPGELTGTWRHGDAVLTIAEDGTFTATGLPRDHIVNLEGTSGGPLDAHGRLTTKDTPRVQGLREVDFFSQPATEPGGIIQAAFDPTTDPVSIGLIAGSAKSPTFYRLAKQR